MVRMRLKALFCALGFSFSVFAMDPASQLKETLRELSFRLNDLYRDMVGVPALPPGARPAVPAVPPLVPPREEEEEPTIIPSLGKPAPVKLPFPGAPGEPKVPTVTKFKLKPREVEIPKEERIEPTSVTYVGITAQVQILQAMPTGTPEEQRIKKNKAISILMGLDNLVGSKTPNDPQKQSLIEAVDSILEINPLGIHAAIELLTRAGIDQKALYNRMRRFFDKKVTYLETEFGKIKKGGQLTFDIRYNIEEAFFYPETIKDKLETAKTAGTPDSRTFVNNMNNLYERLVKLLKENKDILRAVDVPVEIYERRVAGNPVYCITEVRPDNIYVTIFDNLNQLEDGINAYSKPYTTQRLRLYVISEALKMLKDIVSIYEKECKICLGSELRRYLTDEALKNKVDGQLRLIEKFLGDIKTGREAEVDEGLQYLQRLKKILTSATCPLPRAL